MERPYGDAVAVGRGHEGVRLDREMRDDRERVGVVHDEVGRRGIDVAPAHPVLLEDVALGQRIVRAQGRVLDERGSRTKGGRQRHDGRQLLVVDPHEAGPRLGGVLRVGGHDGHGVAVVLRLPDGEDGPVRHLRAEAWHRLGQVGSRHHQVDTRDGQCVAGVDGHDPGPSHGHRHEPGVQLVGQVDVGHVLLAAADPGVTSDPAGGVADAGRVHDPASSATAWTAAMICS